jgi:hypothetical protein
MRENSQELQNFIHERSPKFFKTNSNNILTQEDILQAVLKDELFGMVEVDIRVPEKWGDINMCDTMSPHQYFEEMSPLFCTTEVPYDSIGTHMQDHAKNIGMNFKTRKLLLGGMKGEKMLLATPLLKWYLEHGMEVTKVHQVIEYNRMSCFKNFVQDVTNARRCGDTDPDQSIFASLFKLIGNSAYGSTILNKLNQTNVKYIQGESNACIYANDPLFKSMTQLAPDFEFYEVESQKKSIKLDLPIQIGYFILQYAKLRLLQFYYDFLDKFIPRNKFQLLQCDTDSMYFGIASETLDQVIKPEFIEEYKRKIEGECNDCQIDASDHWFPRSCCKEHAKYDSRKPGLFKLEYSGDLFYGLCSKTYFVGNGKEYKFSSKGISKSRVKDPLNTFKNVLETKQSSGAPNMGFICKNNSMFTYKQNRDGFAYFYCKRQIQDDGISTIPLQLTLKPIQTKFHRST